jgi:RecA-family ATPase
MTSLRAKVQRDGKVWLEQAFKDFFAANPQVNLFTGRSIRRIGMTGMFVDSGYMILMRSQQMVVIQMLHWIKSSALRLKS